MILNFPGQVSCLSAIWSSRQISISQIFKMGEILWVAYVSEKLLWKSISRNKHNVCKAKHFKNFLILWGQSFQICEKVIHISLRSCCELRVIKAYQFKHRQQMLLVDLLWFLLAWNRIDENANISFFAISCQMIYTWKDIFELVVFLSYSCVEFVFFDGWIVFNHEKFEIWKLRKFCMNKVLIREDVTLLRKLNLFTTHI